MNMDLQGLGLPIPVYPLEMAVPFSHIYGVGGGKIVGYSQHQVESSFRKRPPNYEMPSVRLDPTTSRVRAMAALNHPLFFVENHNEEIKRDCSECTKPLSGPVYHCVDCSYPKFFNLHEECVELSLEIKHPYDRNYPLTLLSISPTHPHNCSCYLCKIQWEGFVYSCSICKLELTLDDLSTPPKITIASHKHPWKLLFIQMSFICDFCGIAGDHTPYLCTKKIILQIGGVEFITMKPIQGMTVTIVLHPIAYYIAHVHCATNKAIWDGTIVLEDNDESCKETQQSSLNLITEIVEQTSIGEHMVATEIKHEYHDHNSRLTFSVEIKDEA
ncbi:hypothetical protein F3Y22_tig00116958pilonHSYRG00032 [Hibiscus syriacus]|uniref:Uncharacterized protein n=1 Tax=Hibiscus syriacus TaxID=106335 RepID=A0A6A2WXS3_HIBSY|nr:hypothetical protein F3Y22_tig00116958pilonHSYRG00032 [Hibiscus syriacus]